MSGEQDSPDHIESSNLEGVIQEHEQAIERLIQEGTPDIPVQAESVDETRIRSEVLAEEERRRLELLYRLEREKKRK